MFSIWIRDGSLSPFNYPHPWLLSGAKDIVRKQLFVAVWPELKFLLAKNYLSSNIAVNWITLLMHILEVSDSNLGRDNGYSDWGFPWFLYIAVQKAEYLFRNIGPETDIQSWRLSWFASAAPGKCRDIAPH